MKIELFDTFVNVFSIAEYINIFSKYPDKNRPFILYYLNTYSAYLCKSNPKFKHAFNNADYIVPDGHSIVFSLRKLRSVHSEKISPTTIFLNVLGKLFEKKKLKIFILGGDNNNLDTAVTNIKKLFPNINIAAYFNGFFENEQEEFIKNMINSSKADVLLVAMGMPKSEVWIEKNKYFLDVKYIITVGAFVNFLSGHKKLAPDFLRNTGLEWLYRLFQEPKRLTGRYLLSHTYFLFLFAKEFLRKFAR